LLHLKKRTLWTNLSKVLEAMPSCLTTDCARC
jgi:hypothetical protein